MSENTSLTLERLAYISLITLCMISGGFLIRDQVRASWARTHPHGPLPSNLVGRTLPIKGADWNASKLSVVLFLSSTCHFCEASVPFYNRLLAEHKHGQGKATPIIAVSAERADDLANHFAREHLGFDHVYQIALPNSLLWATPTLMVVDDHGVIQRADVGQVDSVRENEIQQIIRTGELGDNAHEKGGLPTN